MQLTIDLQLALTENKPLPTLETMENWARCALQIGGRSHDSEITIRMVSNEEIQELNKTYRHIDKPTNILSFPFEMPEGIEELPLLGDLVIAYDVTLNESIAQHKTFEEHLAHLIVHGCLHLLGYDHIEEQDRLEMEPLEIKAMLALGFDNPYKDDEI
jgi:probable rRNA maturation factor